MSSRLRSVNAHDAGRLRQRRVRFQSDFSEESRQSAHDAPPVPRRCVGAAHLVPSRGSPHLLEGRGRRGVPRDEHRGAAREEAFVHVAGAGAVRDQLEVARERVEAIEVRVKVRNERRLAESVQAHVLDGTQERGDERVEARGW